MNQLSKFFRNVLIVLCFFIFETTKAQEKTFYVRLLESAAVASDSLVFQPICFQSEGIVYNNIVELNNESIRVLEPGFYEVNGFVNINPGISGSSIKDKVDVSVYLMKNYLKSNQETIMISTFSFTLGNLDVANSFNFFVPKLALQPTDDLQVLVKYLPSSTRLMNEGEKYHQVNKPTGMMQIAALRIYKKTDAK